MKRLVLLLCWAGVLTVAGTRPAAALVRPSTRPVRCSETLAAPDVPDLPLPAIPDTLRVPALRAAYLIEHFWDAMDFADPARGRNRAFVEQHLVNFLSLFPHADPASRAPAVAQLMQRAEADAGAYRLVAELAEKYLFESDSPMRSEEIWMRFLERIADAPVLDAYERIRPNYQLGQLRKNLPGTVAADFAYVTRDGEATTLRNTATGDRMLLMLYDATCAHCREVMEQLRRAPQLTQAVDAGRVEVLAVCLDADRAALLASSAELPETWMTGYEEGGIIENDTYMLHALPVLLLLDSEQRVLLRHPSVEQLLAFLAAGE